MNITQSGIVMLLRSGITGEKLTLPDPFSIEEAALILRRQSVVPLAYQGAVNCGFAQESVVVQQMLGHYYRNLLKHERQMCALEQLLRAFEESAVPHMPVKGCNIKKLYPKPELRAMGDADILIHPEQHDRIRPIMEGLGYTFLRENDHVFEWKSDDLYVELHKSLIPPDDEDFHAYYFLRLGRFSGPGIRRPVSARHGRNAADRHYRYRTGFPAGPAGGHCAHH